MNSKHKIYVASTKTYPAHFILNFCVVIYLTLIILLVVCLCIYFNNYGSCVKHGNNLDIIFFQTIYCHIISDKSFQYTFPTSFNRST